MEDEPHALGLADPDFPAFGKKQVNKFQFKPDLPQKYIAQGLLAGADAVGSPSRGGRCGVSLAGVSHLRRHKRPTAGQFGAAHPRGRVRGVFLTGRWAGDDIFECKKYKNSKAQ